MGNRFLQLGGLEIVIGIDAVALDESAAGCDQLVIGVQREGAVAGELLRAAGFNDEKTIAIDGHVRGLTGGLNLSGREIGFDPADGCA